MKRYLKILFVLLTLLQVLNLEAQSSFRFFNLTKDNGLNSDVITAVVEDSNGFIWVGTQTGLYRFDGKLLEPIHSLNDSINMTGCNIADLKVDSLGDIWIVTENGVSKYCVSTNKVYRYPVNLNGTFNTRYRADKLFVANNNQVLFFSQEGYLCKFNHNNNCFEKHCNTFFGRHSIQFCFADLDQSLWLVDANSYSVYHINNEGILIDSLVCSTKKPYPLYVATALLNNLDGTLWLGSYTGIYQISTADHTITLLEDLDGKPLPKSVKTFYKQPNGDIWIGTNGEELYIVNRENKSVNIVKSDDNQQSIRKLNSRTINSMFKDSNGIMWLGTWHGLSYLDTKNSCMFDFISFPEDDEILNLNQISAICADKNGNLAIGSDGCGVVFWDGKSSSRYDLFSHLTSGSTMPNSSILAAAYDKYGNLWTGGYNNPLHKLSANHDKSECFSMIHNVPNVKSDFIVDIVFDHKDRMWVLTNGAGLFLFNPTTKQFSQVTQDSRNVPPCSMFGTCLACTNDNIILVGTYSGLYVYYPDDNIIENHSYIEGIPYTLSHNVVNDITIDNQNRVWVATQSGINLFDVDRGVFLRKLEDTLKNINCTNIIVDKMSYIWITTNNGILKCSTDANAIYRLYAFDDGVLTYNFEKNTSFVADNGKIYIGAHDGLILFSPNDLTTSVNVPKPIIINLLINYQRVMPNSDKSPLIKTIANSDEITLDWSDITFSLEFSALDYIFGKSLTFYYKLDGYDKEWTNIGSRHEVGFTNLNPGTYTFRLLAENLDGVRSKERTLIINIRPPWYKTKFAIISFVILALLFIWLLHLLKIRTLRQRQRLLESMVKERTTKLSNLNAVLESHNEEMKQQNEEIQSQRDELFAKNHELKISRAALQKSYQDLLNLSNLDKQISKSLDIENIVETIYNNSVVPLNQCGFCICKLNKTNNNVVFSSYIENNAKTELDCEPFSSLSDNLTALCFKECIEIVADNTSLYDIPDNLMQKGYRTCVRIPLFCNDLVVAVMIINSRNENAFSKNDIAIFKVIASYSEIVIEKYDAYSLLKSRNLALNGSIAYAKTIQQILLPQISDFKQYFDADIIYRPRDIVSGDFIWLFAIGGTPNMIFTSVIDCTGHGVPGAFMSLVSNQMLMFIVKNKQVYQPADILTQLSQLITSILKQENGENKDGMDMSICRFDIDNQGHIFKMTYSGAKNPICYVPVGANQCSIIKGDRISIAGGIKLNNVTRCFTQQSFNVNVGDTIYMFTDGIIDQSNKARVRFGRKRLIECINNNIGLSIEQQIAKLANNLDQFVANTEQRDDITFLAFKIREKTFVAQQNNPL